MYTDLNVDDSHGEVIAQEPYEQAIGTKLVRCIIILLDEGTGSAYFWETCELNV